MSDDTLTTFSSVGYAKLLQITSSGGFEDFAAEAADERFRPSPE
jgi:hypothetical protein